MFDGQPRISSPCESLNRLTRSVVDVHMKFSQLSSPTANDHYDLFGCKAMCFRCRFLLLWEWRFIVCVSMKTEMKMPMKRAMKHHGLA
jgi:hypothetical protein